jgi:hypothetical protein
MIGMVKLLALAALLAGCEASLSPGNGNGTTDANGSGSGSGNIDASMQMQPDAAPACANGRKLFLNFDGVTLSDAASSDATTNTARWLVNTPTATIPPWRNGSGTRATEILQVTDGVKARLGMTSPIEVVTTRPATGPYVMIVLGGANTGNGGTVGTVYSYATSFHDCGDTTKSDVGWVSDMNTAAVGMNATTTYVADLVVGSVGWGLGLNGTTDGNDCMCAWTTSCTDNANACTLSTSIASGVTNPGAGETACPNQNPQNEVAAFTTGFCN